MEVDRPGSLPSDTPESPHLPQEIFDIIMDQLHDEKTALAQCTLVCRDWVPSSTKNLFSCLRFPPCVYLWDDIENWFQSSHATCVTTGAKSYSDLLAVVLSSTRIRAAVRELKLSGQRYMPHDKGANSTVQWLDYDDLSPQILCDLANAFPRLRSIALAYCDAPPAETFGSVDHVPKIEHLKLKVNFSGSFLHIPYFRSVGDLVIRSLYTEQNDLPIIPAEHRPQVTSLRLPSVSNGLPSVLSGIYHVLPRLLNAASVRALTVCRPPSQELDLFIRCFSNLESLTLPLSREHHYDLSVPPLLRSITMTTAIFFNGAGEDQWEDPLASLARGLHLFASQEQTLRELGVGILIELNPHRHITAADLGEYFLYQLDWSPVTRALERYTRLKTLRVEVLVPEGDLPRVKEDTPQYVSAMRETAEKHLPLGQQCRLEVVAAGIDSGYFLKQFS